MRIPLSVENQIAFDAIEGALSLEEAAQLFLDCDRGEDPISYVIPEAEVVSRLVYEPPQKPEERAELETRVRGFFWNRLENALGAERDEPAQQQRYPL